jgi:hypothetical protein
MLDPLSQRLRLTQSFERRLRAGAAEVRAMALAETVDWEPPEFDPDEATSKRQSIHCCARAAMPRAALHGDLSDRDLRQ